MEFVERRLMFRSDGMVLVSADADFAEIAVLGIDHNAEN
jgi:hypothetical protein